MTIIDARGNRWDGAGDRYTHLREAYLAQHPGREIWFMAHDLHATGWTIPRIAKRFQVDADNLRRGIKHIRTYVRNEPPGETGAELS